jgi:hypothetical protein
VARGWGGRKVPRTVSRLVLDFKPSSEAGRLPPMKIQISDHLILPFGTARKFDLQRIKLSSVAANGIYLSSDIPCIYINVAQKKPLTMQDYGVFITGEHGPEPYEQDVSVGLDFIHELIKKSMPAAITTKYEVKIS